METNNLYIPPNGGTTHNIPPSSDHGVCPGCGRCRTCGQPSLAPVPYNPIPYMPSYPSPTYHPPLVWGGDTGAGSATGWTGAVAINFYKSRA